MENLIENLKYKFLINKYTEKEENLWLTQILQDALIKT
jgi:hypothetical protein